MTTKAIIRPHYYDRSFRFFNTQTNRIEDNIWSDLESGMWREFDIDAFLYNERQYASNVAQKGNIHKRNNHADQQDHWKTDGHTSLDCIFDVCRRS